MLAVDQFLAECQGRPECASGLGFQQKLNIHVISCCQRSYDAPEEVCTVVNGDEYILRTGFCQGTDMPLQETMISYRHERLWYDFRERAQPGTKSTRDN
ncbi:hypothetical protein CBM2637_A170045 [Cupriavidus taiwanensis]|nr:hypothetical protein CBM2637_A170045 [Cupriavidus taiwanensis]SPA36836.1 hypothetical protein CBM2606_A100061 [Cupriavidus taiwanensis]SPA49809.1 protein of unknown function [Cupriavidus taiwanensis]